MNVRAFRRIECEEILNSEGQRRLKSRQSRWNQGRRDPRFRPDVVRGEGCEVSIEGGQARCRGNCIFEAQGDKGHCGRTTHRHESSCEPGRNTPMRNHLCMAPE